MAMPVRPGLATWWQRRFWIALAVLAMLFLALLAAGL